MRIVCIGALPVTGEIARSGPASHQLHQQSRLNLVIIKLCLVNKLTKQRRPLSNHQNV